MVRRLLQLAALAVAVVVAIGAGTMVRHHLAAPDPIDVAETATRAYSTGDCDALRDVAFDPGLIVCADVAAVRDAYRSEGLKPDTFHYDLVSQDGDQASVRITYRRDGRPAEEIVLLQRRGDAWLIVASPLGGG